MIAAGLDVVRLNFSHGDAADHIRRAQQVREAAAAAGREVGVLADLQGPKIRIERFKEGRVKLAEGDDFILDIACDTHDGDQTRVGLTYKELIDDVVPGDVLLLDVGAMELKVKTVEGSEIRCSVLIGGILKNSKGINRQGGGLSAAALTDKDKADIITAAALEADYIAVSFPRNAADIHQARELLRAAGGHGGVVAKIERADSLACAGGYYCGR